MENKDYFMYVILCTDGSFYGGFTDNVERRFQTHLAGKGAKYTKRHKPVKILYSEEFDTKSLALKAEYAFKHQSRSDKEQFLIDHGITKKDWKI